MGTHNGVELDELELADETLLLRRWQPDDAGRVLAVMQDRSMFDFLALPDPYDEAAALEFVTTRGHEGRDAGTGLGCAVVERDGNRVVGSAALRLGGTPEIGYWIAPDGRGHGYAARVTRMLATFGFERLQLPRITILTDVRNVASARSALAAGFRYEGTVRGGAAPAALGAADLAWFGRLAGDPADPVPPAFPSLPPDLLADDVVSLRMLEPGDAGRLTEFDDEVALRVGFGNPPLSPAEDTRLADRDRLDGLVGSRVHLAIVDTATDALAGLVTLRHAGPPQIWGLGYVVHPLFRGRGYTTRALRLLAPWAFTHGVARLELGAKVHNTASQRAALAAGFEPDGVWRHRLREPDGSYADEQRFCLIPTVG